MSAKGYCCDNAACESFFASLKCEAFPTNQVFESKADARIAIFDYLETFYNKRRRHSFLGYMSPEQFLDQHIKKTTLSLTWRLHVCCPFFRGKIIHFIGRYSRLIMGNG
ncbi:MAG: hypothetical protein ACI8UO_001176 [Verrucomicrobiales bacterium]|jgi:hypothetical protein